MSQEGVLMAKPPEHERKQNAGSDREGEGAAEEQGAAESRKHDAHVGRVSEPAVDARTYEGPVRAKGRHEARSESADGKSTQEDRQEESDSSERNAGVDRAAVEEGGPEAKQQGESAKPGTQSGRKVEAG
jgi:hypothetical protein